jgi:hypothetical protein
LQYHQAVSNTASSPSSNRSTVRFAVGKPEGPRSTVWRLWTHKNEVYISAWSLASDVKISLHSSGDWREALTTEHAAKGSPFVAPGQDRTIDKWQRPAEFVAGATKAFMIVVPSSEVTTPRHPEANTAFRQKLGGKAVVWVPAAPEGYATHFTVLFTRPEATAATLPGWPGRKSMGTRFIWRTELPNGQSMWVVSHERPNIFQRWLAAGKRELAEFSDTGEPRGCIRGRNRQDGTRFYVDVSGESPES